jgi:hypothetical protein
VRLVRVRVLLHVLALRVRHQQRVGGHWLLWGRGGVLRVGRLLRNRRRCIRCVVHGLRHLAGGLSVNGPSVLVMLG